MIPQPAIDLILDAEGIDQPGQWPGGDSGVTLGHGFDLSSESPAELVKFWTPEIGTPAVNRLLQAIGKSRSAASAIATHFRDITITAKESDDVFFADTLPKYEQLTAGAFPGCTLLPDLARGALVSLVYNRGASMAGDSRHEMLMIRQALQAWSNLSESTRAAGLRPLLLTLATQIRSMKRLWQGKGLDGLLRRRESEARLVESAIPTPV